ncbi:Uma2 family endonuclease [Nocardia sp. NPDC006044]|uniref:Uma2 family endonuclease n=1 Tax=Nocardia sp. NPDC006044 TaxID=3364306 RepID=UPI00367FAB72
MVAVRGDVIHTEEFEVIARAVERETEGVRAELIGGRLEVKRGPDGNHGRILNWLLLLLMPLHPGLFLHVAGQGLIVGARGQGRLRPDGVLAPLDAFVGSGEWGFSDAVVMVVEVTSPDPNSTWRDRVEKPIVYAQTGIPIYLLIDREAARVVVHSESDGDRYQDVHSYAFGREVTLPAQVGISFDSSPLEGWGE